MSRPSLTYSEEQEFYAERSRKDKLREEKALAQRAFEETEEFKSKIDRVRAEAKALGYRLDCIWTL